MATKQSITKLTIKGYKSIQKLEGFGLKSLNVLIGSNGAGKVNIRLGTVNVWPVPHIRLVGTA